MASSLKAAPTRPVGSSSRNFRRSLSTAEVEHALAGAFDERQIFRIDHYPAGNRQTSSPSGSQRIFEPLLDRIRGSHPDHRRRVARVEPRRLYDGSGALRDMVQTT